MSRGLAEQIAVLDGLNGNVIDAYGMINASNGANYSGGSSYPENNPIPLMTSSVGLAGSDQDVINAYGMINASNGANYSGGSNYPEQNAIPLMTSSIGLAGSDDVINAYNMINASNGANYSGGSSYPENNPIPLMTSSVGLAGTMKGFADADLLAYANGVGQIPDVLPAKMNVLDASGGANYSGGSSYAPGLPLLPSSAGLAAMTMFSARAIRKNPTMMHNLKIVQSLSPAYRAKVLAISKAIMNAKRAKNPTAVAKLRDLRNKTIKMASPASTGWR